MLESSDLGGGVWSFQTPLWQTNSLLAVADGDALLCDPAFTPAEIEAIGADARRRAHNAVFLLVTHADYDHVCGLPYFPEAEVDTYDIRGGNARRVLADLGTGA